MAISALAFDHSWVDVVADVVANKLVFILYSREAW